MKLTLLSVCLLAVVLAKPEDDEDPFSEALDEIEDGRPEDNEAEDLFSETLDNTDSTVANARNEVIELNKKEEEESGLKWDFNTSAAYISHSRNIFDNPDHRLRGTISITRNLFSQDVIPEQITGSLAYTDKGTGITAFIGSARRKDEGANVNGGLKYNIKDDHADIELGSKFERHIGKLPKTGHNNVVFVNLNGSFF